jgi:CheY-like chemotaxis protein
MVNALSLPYFHPSTVVFLDDNHQFLSDLELRLPGRMPYILHEDPSVALAEVNRHAATPTLANRCFSRLEIEPGSWRDSVIEFDVALIEEEVNSVERFHRTSVVVVDYAMPAMNGLEFCEKITDPYVKKLLLTGAADEKLAVRAFNDGLIDRFILKNQPDSLDLMLRFVDELQIAHFQRQQTILAAALSLNPPPFIYDPTLLDEIERLAHRHSFIEHYLVGDPPGYLLLTSSGEIQRLMVMDEREFAVQTERAGRYAAPEELLSAMQAHRKIVCVYESLLGDHAADYPWHEFAFDTWPVEGASTWWLALISQPPVSIDFDPGASSLDAYLAVLDAS